MIEVSNVRKSYGAKEALKGISFSVKEGEVVGFLGPNGAGKTTAMRILTCCVPPTEGSAQVCGHDIHKNPLDVRRSIGYLPENVPLYSDMTVGSYLEFVGRLKGVAASSMKSHLAQVLEECAVADVRGKLIKNLSKGYKQRVGIAQSLVGNPPILILDEPTVGLDPKQIIEIRELIRTFAGKKTVILSTHILPEVSQVCTRVLIINEGRIVAEDTPLNLGSRMQDSSTVKVEFIPGKTPWEKILNGVKGVLDSKKEETPAGAKSGLVSLTITSNKDMDIRADLAKVLVDSGARLLELKSVNLTLEDVFIRLVTEERSEQSGGNADEKSAADIQ